jgi:Aspartyl protease
MNRRNLAMILFLAVCLSAGPLLPAKRPTPESVERLARLYEEGRYFELRDALATRTGDPSPDLEFFRGVVDQVFNRPGSAVLRLRAFLEASRNAPPRMLTKDAFVFLADTYRRLGRYGEASACFREALTRLGPRIRADERPVYENQAEAWSSLAGIPPMEVEVAADATIRMTRRLIPARVGERTFFVGYDTGANMSVLLESLAAELGVPVLGPALKVQIGTGGWVDGRLGVVPEMSLGPIVVRNAVFFVLADKHFPPSEAGPGVERLGFLGAPVLVALKEFTETASGELIVPSRPLPRSPENMCLAGFMPVVEAVYRGARLLLCLDTGASATSLFPPFYRRFRGEINNRAKARKFSVKSAGDSRLVPVRVLDWFGFRAGGKDFALRHVMVQTKETHADSRCFHGAIGVDILSLCSRMTLNFESMTFALE